jgi:hypothetical protein
MHCWRWLTSAPGLDVWTDGVDRMMVTTSETRMKNPAHEGPGALCHPRHSPGNRRSPRRGPKQCHKAEGGEVSEPIDCACPPCPGRGNDGHGMTHCAECCWGTRVEADLDCPVHGDLSPTWKELDRE